MSTLTLEDVIARTAGHTLNDPEETDAYALARFVGGVVESAGENPTEESVVAALTEAIVTDPILFRFLVLRYKESEIVRGQSLEGGVLDQKVSEAEKLIGAIWRYVP